MIFCTTALQCWNNVVPIRNNVAMLAICCTKNCPCESVLCNITLVLIQLLFDYQKYALIFNKQVVHIVIYSLFLGFFLEWTKFHGMTILTSSAVLLC